MSAIIVRILGKSGSGKTTFITGLISRLCNLKISVIKHTRHHLEPPHPSKDTGIHFQSGSVMVAGLSSQTGELFFREPCIIGFEEVVALFSTKSDVILVEGAREHNLPTILIGECPQGAKADNIIMRLPVRPSLDDKLFLKVKELLTNE